MKLIQSYWEPYERSGFELVEPFCGGLGISLGLLPKKAQLNDINPHLINFYNQLRSGFITNLEMKNNEVLYYTYRQKFNNLIKEGKWKTSEAALLFYFLNHTCYNGLCRFNRKGFFNVPFGNYKNITYVRDFQHYRPVFQNWEFTTKDFEDLEVNKNKFVYADPPYDVEFRRYSSIAFEWSDQVRLANWINNINVPALISNQATTRIVKLYKSLNFQIIFLDGPRMISCNGNRSPAKEVLAIKKN